ncbi:glycoside hydrolase family 55 protein [Mucilaginibacter sp. BJC16-A38]|uniref:glycoside hydrolase family 55 protein n=1 Tax=Mucilaginibacter phenanthrenivorans TaxID=1234842 RepID=UPI0021577650|nr:glycoside hydrolase family 55 protein [Mucilaginibacter phenanthrenivorans]MCR8558138.1 glycoside hydrolase family 55 protein [Mucilaginibacter phenanthrenivorans]
MTTIANYIALSTYAYTTGNEFIFVQGSTTTGDGGQGTFFWDPAVTIGTDNATIFVISGSGAWVRLYSEYVNVKWFGALGDGVHDDTAAINNALTHFNTVEITAGIYNISNIVIPTNTTLIITPQAVLNQKTYVTAGTVGVVEMASGSTLTGGGVISCDSTVSDYANINYGIYILGDDCAIENITLMKSIYDCIFAQNCNNLVISDFTGINVGHGATFIRCNQIVINNYTLQSPTFNYTMVYPHCLDLFYCDGYKINSVNIFNVNASSTAPSLAISGITLGGNSNGLLQNVLMSGFLSTVKTGLPIPDDGSINCVITGVTIKGWNYSTGLEVQGCRNCIYDDIVLDGTVINNTIGGTEGIHVLETAVTGGLVPASYSGYQVRDRALASNNTFSNIRIIGGFTGIRVAASFNKFINCETIGNTYGFRLCQVQGGVQTGWWQSNIVEYIESNEFINCSAKQCIALGFVIFGGQNNKIINPRLVNNNIGIGNAYNLKLITSTVTDTSISIDTTVVANAWAGYYLFVTTGGTTNPYQLITSNTTNTFTIAGTWGTTYPIAGNEFVIVDNPQGDVYINGGTITDDQNVTYSKLGSMTGNFTSLSAINQLTITSQGEKFNYNQKIKLLNIISGASSPDLIVQISSLNYGSTDIFNIKPLTLGDGSPLAGSLTLPLIAGTGTITSANQVIGSGVTSLINGTGTNFPAEIDAHYWILINGTTWAQILQAKTATQYYLVNQLPSNVTGATFQIVKFDLQGIPSQLNGVSFNRYYGNVILDGTTIINNSTSANLNTFESRSVVFVKIPTNITTPDVSTSIYYATSNGVSTMINNFHNAYAGKRIIVQVMDSMTIFQFTGATNLKGYASNYTANSGDILTAVFDGTSWYCQITPANGIGPQLEKFGSSTQSGNGTIITFTVAHGLSGVSSASYVNVTGRSAAAANISWVDIDTTNIYIHYNTAPVTGTNNLIWNWEIKP